MQPSINDLQRYCTELEKLFRPAGFHVALTGSSLYGHPGADLGEIIGKKFDIDIMVYPHECSKPRHQNDFKNFMEKNFTDHKVIDFGNYSDNRRCVYTGLVMGIRVDFIYVS